MIIQNRLTGGSLNLTKEDRQRARLARLRNRVYWAIQCVSRETQTEGTIPIGITLTYRDVDAWRPGHISEFMKWCRVEFSKTYVWVAELQKRGAMHYHVLTTRRHDQVWNKSEIEFQWYNGLVWVTDHIEKPFYMMKYLQKGKQKNGREYPRGARIVGYAGNFGYISHKENRERLASRLPRWVLAGVEPSEFGTVGGDILRTSGGYSYMGQLAFNPYTIESLDEPEMIKFRMGRAFRSF